MKWGKVRNVTIYTLIENTARHSTELYGQHGISFLLDIKTANTKKRILFDTGQDAKPILHNMNEMNLNSQNIDMIFLSHCHYDHTGGLVGMLKAIDKDNVPIIAHPTIFRQHFYLKPSLKEKGITAENSREKIENQGGKLFLTKAPFSLLEGVISTGEITNRTKFEPVNMDVYTIKNDELKKDKIQDDMSLILRFPNKIVILAGCSHAGIVGITKKAQMLFEKNNIYAVIGGFHLLNASNKRITKTTDALQDMGVEKIYTGHCTGLKAQAEFMKKWGQDFEQLQAGKVIQIIS